jgi:hypothetical protein
MPPSLTAPIKELMTVIGVERIVVVDDSYRVRTSVEDAIGDPPGERVFGSQKLCCAYFLFTTKAKLADWRFRMPKCMI